MENPKKKVGIGYSVGNRGKLTSEKGWNMSCLGFPNQFEAGKP